LKKNNHGFEELAHVLGEADHLRYRGATLPISRVNVLPQPRKTFENVAELALDIASKNLLNPPTIAHLSVKNCKNYLRVINTLWGTTFQVSDLVSSSVRGKKIFYILLAGERRFRACRLLWDEGCMGCVRKYRKEKPGTCFRRHFQSNRIEVRLCFNIQPLSALYIQLSENTHMRVPPEQEAYAYNQLFKLVKKANPEFTLSAFAEKVGRSPETIRHALQFCELPSVVREAVEKREIPYGIALELFRIYERKANDNDLNEELQWWVLRGITEAVTVPEFRQKVGEYLSNLDSGQKELLAIMSEAELKELKRLHIRKTVEVHALRAIWGYIGYFERVKNLFDQGLLGQKESPFSKRSPRKILRKHIAQLRVMLPHLRRLLPKRGRESLKVERTLMLVEGALARFGDSDEENTSMG
jgi:hypothetical protein